MRISAMQRSVLIGILFSLGTSLSSGSSSNEVDDAAELRGSIEQTLSANGDDSLGRLKRLSSLLTRLRKVEKNPIVELRGAKAMLRWGRRDIRFAKTHYRALDVQLKHLAQYDGFADVALMLRLEALNARRVASFSRAR